MAFKRKRRASPSSKGLAAGEQLKRNKLACHDYSAWGWVGTEVLDASNISEENILATCGFSKRSSFATCPNIYGSRLAKPIAQQKEVKDNDDVIVISDDDVPQCHKKACKNNPNCLNHLGQEIWEDEGEAENVFSKTAKLGHNPILDVRDPNLPVGLKNLGATCYANAFLQVWFRDLAFRNGVYQCQPSQDTAHHFEKSPIFQLQVTFAALQESTQSVYNPTNLVESLQLRTTEQQDAQEFSKLFISHLDAEFQKQSDPSLRSLITSQFQGRQVYGTICENLNCDYRSELASDFLEIEINFENNSTLEDRIAALLQPERLSGDNKYLCSKCESLQDATRYTELRQLPPILHFSLLRFVYDFTSMERKKSKHSISFPFSLDMGRFLRTASTSHTSHETSIYELRGVLLHKGTSAYHGHYEAQVYDTTNQTWFQFNDETVTKIKASGKNTEGAVVDVEILSDNEKPLGLRKQRANARKKRRVDDSDDEIAGSSKETHLKESARVTSRDAYMLIYSRKETSPGASGCSQPNQTLSTTPTPPDRALNVIQKLNAAHDEACEIFQQREKQVKRCFEDTRLQVRDIYRTWHPSFDEKPIVVSRHALESWLSSESMISALEHYGILDEHSSTATVSQDKPVETNDRALSPRSIDIGQILCTHGKLDPQKANDMKRISRVACQKITTKTHCKFQPTLSTDGICKICVQAIFNERLYHIEHPRLVSQFDQLCEEEDCKPGYWISKLWLRDWRLVNPKMHVTAEKDPPPDAPQFDRHVRCEHNGLSLNSTGRRRISEKAARLLMDLFPSWNPVRSDTELCPVCEALIQISKEDKREVRKMVEDEKARLKHMHDNALNGNTLLLENVPCSVIPVQFVRSWLQWLLRPSEIPRPGTIDNSPFICTHELLNFDPNDPTDLDETIALITRNDWDALEELYSAGPLIALEKCVADDNSHTLRYIHEVPVCVECRQKRKLDYETTDITIRVVSATDRQVGHTAHNDTLPSTSAKPTTNGYHKASGVRHSKRLRRIKESGVRRKFSVTKKTTVKDIKVTLQEELNIPTICQRLFYRGHELEDNSATVTSLGLLANDTLELREESESQASDSDSDEIRGKKRQREEERGFGGTLLSQLPNVPTAISINLNERSCSACTFSNLPDASFCTVCTNPLA